MGLGTGAEHGCRKLAALAALCLPALGVGQGCAEGPATSGTGPTPPAAGYPLSGSDALLRGAGNRLGGVSGGFAESLGFADYSYRLGTSTELVPEAAVEALVAAHGDQIRLSDDHRDALRRVLTERPAFAAFEQFFTDGGRVRAYTPLGKEELAKRPPSQLVLAGQGRYLPDHLVIVGRADEPAMEEFLFHEIQHYIFDRWDSPAFEAGEADHAVIRILEQRRRLVGSIRAGRVPEPPDPLAALFEPVASRQAEAASDGGAGLYRAWVETEVGRLRAKNETNRGVRIVSMELASGETLLIDERGDREAPDEIRAMNVRVPPHYRYGPVVYVSVADLRSFDAEPLFSGGHVGEADRAGVIEFIEAHRRDSSLGRGHIFSDPEIQDLAHLSAVNAAIFLQARRLGDHFRDPAGTPLEEAMAGDPFRAAFSDFLARFVDRMGQSSGADPRHVAAEVAGELLESRPSPTG